MRFSRRNVGAIKPAITRCYFDADHGRPWLAVRRLKELGDEFPENAHVLYAEGVIRRDSLGQGIVARELFEQAYHCATRRDHRNTRWLAVCNASGLAASEQEFRKWSELARRARGRRTPEYEEFRRVLESIDGGQSFAEIVIQRCAAERGGPRAALADVALNTSLTREGELLLRKARAEDLRGLDADIERRREAMAEAYPPDERQMLHAAVREMERAIELDEYDPILWNYKAGWCVLLEQYEDAIRAADRAIALRPHHYPRPYVNKAQALWRSGRAREALACAQEAERQSRSGADSYFDVKQARTLVEMCAHTAQTPSPDEYLSLISVILENALKTSEEEFQRMKGHLRCERVVERLVGHLSKVRRDPFMGYVPLVDELLTDFTPETAYRVSLELTKYPGQVVEYVVSSALYLMAYGEELRRRDAARYAVLMTLHFRDAEVIRRYYRQAILATSAAATGPLVAEQEPVTATERDEAARQVVSHLPEPRSDVLL
jgi:tetratricopeptide (TPR) repeat protein